MQNSALIKTVKHYVQYLPFWKKTHKRFSSQTASGRKESLSRRKKTELEMLCFKLFERQDLVTSGRLQLLGLAKVKKRMGRRWPGMQNVIYEICEDTIKKYTNRDDIYLRFGEESYLLLLGSSSLREGQLKAALIAEEIKRRLFEEQGIEDVEVSNEMAPIRSKDLSQDIPFPNSIKIAFDQGIASPPPANRNTEKPSMILPPRIEVEAYDVPQGGSFSLDLGISADEIPFRDVHYLPVWDQSRGRLIAHLCLAKGAGQNAIDAHCEFFQRVGAVERANMDLAVLWRIISWMKDNPEKLAGFGIICPVHYETILGIEGKFRYRALCQKVDERMKQYLLFMVLDLPPAVPWISLSQVVSPLKTYGRVLCGQVQPAGPVDFEAMRLAGFDNVGIILSSSNRNKRVDVSGFVSRAKRYLVNKTFVMGIDDATMAAEVAAAGVHYLGGQAIHMPINEPSEKLAFENYPFSRIWGKASGVA